jgi:hypothetical protein
MNLTTELINEFVKATNDNVPVQNESIVYGTTVEQDGRIYVRLDGAERLTPVMTTTTAKTGERVMVTIKNHTATIIGNTTSPSARYKDVSDAASGATNFMYHDPEVGLEIGDRTTGDWVGCRTLTTSDGFYILDPDGNIVAKYGQSDIELGVDNTSATVKLCNNAIQIYSRNNEGGFIAAAGTDSLLSLMADGVQMCTGIFAGPRVLLKDDCASISSLILNDGLLGGGISSSIDVYPDRIDLEGNVYVNGKPLAEHIVETLPVWQPGSY